MWFPQKGAFLNSLPIILHRGLFLQVMVMTIKSMGGPEMEKRCFSVLCGTPGTTIADSFLRCLWMAACPIPFRCPCQGEGIFLPTEKKLFTALWWEIFGPGSDMRGDGPRTYTPLIWRHYGQRKLQNTPDPIVIRCGLETEFISLQIGMVH